MTPCITESLLLPYLYFLNQIPNEFVEYLLLGGIYPRESDCLKLSNTDLTIFMNKWMEYTNYKEYNSPDAYSS